MEVDTLEIAALLLIGLQLALLVYWSSYQVTRATVPSAVLSLLVAFTILLLSRFEHSRSVQPSIILNVYLLASVAFDAVQVRTLFLRRDEPVILGLFTANIAVKSALLILEAMSKRKYLRAPYRNYSPEVTSGILNRSVFWWINPILATGFRKLLTVDDLFATDTSLKSEVLLEEIQVSWAKCKSYKPEPFNLLTSSRPRFWEIRPAVCVLPLLKMEARVYNIPASLSDWL